MLSYSELALQGIDLADELSEIRSRYHEKSDSNDVLYYEALSLRAKSRDLLEDCGVAENLEQSAMLSAWGSDLAALFPDIANRVRRFHALYAVHQGNQDE